jgi:hypothetical protein
MSGRPVAKGLPRCRPSLERCKLPASWWRPSTLGPLVLRCLRNPVVIFGIVMVLLCWVGACLQVFADRAAAVRVAVERGDTATRLFEKDTVGLFKGIDTIMLLLRQAYEDDPQHFDLIRLADRARLGSDVQTEIFLIAADGYLKQRTTGVLRDSVYLGDRLHFRAQADAKQDDLFIGTPIIQRTTGQPSIQVSRRLHAADGSFAGILSAQIDPACYPASLRPVSCSGANSNFSDRSVLAQSARF